MSGMATAVEKRKPKTQEPAAVANPAGLPPEVLEEGRQTLEAIIRCSHLAEAKELEAQGKDDKASAVRTRCVNAAIAEASTKVKDK